MQITGVKALVFPEVRVIRFARFADHRGYFTETFRKSDYEEHSDFRFMSGIEFVQCNESFSRAETVRGLHFQWNPYMGKMVRALSGHMIDLILDIRKGSPTLGNMIAYDMPADVGNGYDEWIWVPPGFAHGNFFIADTSIEYFCSGEYSPDCEAGISPLAPDIDWSQCDDDLRKKFDGIGRDSNLISDKDRNGFSLEEWLDDARSDNFIYGEM